MAEDANGALLNGARGLAIPISIYRNEFSTGAMAPQDSWNFGPLGHGCDLWNCVNKHPSIHPLAKNIEWAKWSLRSQRDEYGHQGHEWGPWEGIYPRYHTRSWRMIRAVALIVGDHDLVDLCDAFLRESALLGAILAVPWPGANMSAAERAENAPTVWEGTEGLPEPKQMRGLPAIAQAGYRYAVDQGGDMHLDAVYFGGSFELAESLGLKTPPRQQNMTTTVLKDRSKRHGGLPLAGFPFLYPSAAGELAVAQAALRKESKDAVVKCARLLTWPAWGDIHISVTAGGVANILAQFSGSSTPPCEAAAIFRPSAAGKTARQLWLMANPARRKSSAQDLDVAATSAAIDWASRKVTVGRLDGRYPPQTMDLPGGEEWVRIRLRQGGVEVTVPGQGAPTTPPPIRPPVVAGGGGGGGGCAFFVADGSSDSWLWVALAVLTIIGLAELVDRFRFWRYRVRLAAWNERNATCP